MRGWLSEYLKLVMVINGELGQQSFQINFGTLCCFLVKALALVSAKKSYKKHYVVEIECEKVRHETKSYFEVLNNGQNKSFKNIPS